MSRRPPIRAANFLALGCEVYHCTNWIRWPPPTQSPDSIKLGWYTSDRMDPRRMQDDAGMQMWVARCLVFRWMLFRCLGVPSSGGRFPQRRIKVEKLLNTGENAVEKHLKSDYWRAYRTSCACSGVMRNLGHLISSWSHFISLFSALQTQKH